jgi:hypothetical protein
VWSRERPENRSHRAYLGQELKQAEGTKEPVKFLENNLELKFKDHVGLNIKVT